MTERFLVTAALPYSNGRLHVGHIAGAYLPADTYVRFLRLTGKNVRFVCGSDDHGVASLIRARDEGVSVEELTRHYYANQKASFDGLGIRFDIYGGTHQAGFKEIHEAFCEDFFLALYEKGYFTKKTTAQLYDASVGQFLPDRYVKGQCYACGSTDAFGDQCESCGILIDAVNLIEPVSVLSGTRPEVRQTTHWYLRLDQFREQLKTWLASKHEPTDGSPSWRGHLLNFVEGQLKNALPERAMTRDLTWGVPVPIDDPDAKNKVLYVWFDAPIGYVSFTAKLCEVLDHDECNYADWWKSTDCRIVHFIGEDNSIFHALIWPAMLMAEGSYQLPWQVVANAFLNIQFPGQEEEKISKSRGTAIWIEDYLNHFDPDALRYYLTCIAPEGRRTTFDVNGFVERNNNELLARLGNFVNRTLTFTKRYLDNVVPAAGSRAETDLKQLEMVARQSEAVKKCLEQFQFKKGLEQVMVLAKAGNVYFEEKAPWADRKNDMETCATTINTCLQVVKALAVLIEPYLPFSSRKMLFMLGLNEGSLTWDEILSELPEGHRLGTPEVLFSKLDSFSVEAD